MGLMFTHKQRIVGDENVVRAKVDCINKADESDFRLRREFGQYLVASLADFLRVDLLLRCPKPQFFDHRR